VIKKNELILIVCLLPCFHAFAGPEWQVYFSPDGGAADAIVAELNKATNFILVQAYSFTSAPIAKALVDAHKREIMVAIIFDKGQRTAKYSSANFLFRANIQTLIDSKHTIAHNKVMIIDGLVLITGSFNFTKAAEEKNAENLLIIRDKKVVMAYIANWKLHEAHSDVY
jgi:phosphatidylserine/phosphatidylglycerophosphate/cardiolipin synthase-like enzyme